MIPYVLGTTVLIELIKGLTAKAISRNLDVGSECRMYFLGLAVFALSTALFKTPISTPKKIFYESEKATKRSRGIVSASTVLVPLLIFIGLYLLYTRGQTFFGNMGVTICLMSAVVDSIPLQPMHGGNVYNWSKVVWACLFVCSFLFYLLQFVIF